MKNHLTKILSVFLTALLLSVQIHAQQPAADEENIKALRENIQRMVANGPSATSPDDNHRQMLLALQSQLVRLLLKRSGALESRIANLEAPGALPEVLTYASQLRGELKTVNDEITSLDQALGGLLPRVPANIVTPSPTPNPERVAFETAVASIKPSDMAAAVPENLPTASAPLCKANGLPAAERPSEYDTAVCHLASEVVTSQRIILQDHQIDVLTILIAKLLKAETDTGESYAAFVTEAQDRRIDQQTGAGPTSNSATSIVSKGGIPSLLGFAVENGAATQTEKDTSITFRLNPGGLINLFANRGFISSYQASENDAVLKFLNKTSVGLTFDTTRGDTPGVFTGRGQQLSEISARVEVFNDRDPRKKKWAAEWEKFAAEQGNNLAKQNWNTTEILAKWGGKGVPLTFKDPALEAWLEQVNQNLNNVNAALSGVDRLNAIAVIIHEQAEKVPVALVSKTAVVGLTNFASTLKTYMDERNKLLDKIARGRILTFEYTNKREVNASDTSNFNFIYSTGTGKRIDLTTNGSFTFFHSRPALISPDLRRPRRIRDFQFAGQLDVPFRVGDGQFDLWFSGRYERLMEDATLASGVVLPNTKGDIAIGQVGLNVPLKGLGVKFPISVTFANRTELIKEKVVRGNFGFTFNWDTLLSKLKPF